MAVFVEAFYNTSKNGGWDHETFIASSVGGFVLNSWLHSYAASYSLRHQTYQIFEMKYVGSQELFSKMEGNSCAKFVLGGC